AIRVRALVQPTFVRFVFEMPDGVGASSIFNDQKLTLSFNSLLTFDLADAKIAAPPNIASINQKIEGDSTLVEINMIGDVDVHSFREDKSYNIDVAFQQSDKAKAQTLPMAETPAAAAPAPEKPKREAAPEKHSEEIAPPTSETIARQMQAEAKSQPAVASAVPEAPKGEAASAAKETAKPMASAEPAAHTRPAAEVAPPQKETPKMVEAAKPEASTP